MTINPTFNGHQVAGGGTRGGGGAAGRRNVQARGARGRNFPGPRGRGR